MRPWFRPISSGRKMGPKNSRTARPGRTHPRTPPPPPAPPAARRWGRGVHSKSLVFQFGRPPTLPHPCACSTSRAEALNFCVWDGDWCHPLATITQNAAREVSLAFFDFLLFLPDTHRRTRLPSGQPCRYRPAWITQRCVHFHTCQPGLAALLRQVLDEALKILAQ